MRLGQIELLRGLPLMLLLLLVAPPLVLLPMLLGL
jgi:hypothetical protein